MNIILEGPDASGKTTLANVIRKHHPDLFYKPTEGPERYPGEILTRCDRYEQLDNCLFDRHPVISQSIYGKHRPEMTKIPQEYKDRLYGRNDLIIYCASEPVGEHKTKGYDTKAHLKMIEDNDKEIRDDYKLWAVQHAHHMYRIGQPIEPLLQSIKDHRNVV